jgi:hypothetical protein
MHVRLQIQTYCPTYLTIELPSTEGLKVHTEADLDGWTLLLSRPGIQLAGTEIMVELKKWERCKFEPWWAQIWTEMAMDRARKIVEKFEVRREEALALNREEFSWIWDGVCIARLAEDR